MTKQNQEQNQQVTVEAAKAHGLYTEVRCTFLYEDLRKTGIGRERMIAANSGHLQRAMVNEDNLSGKGRKGRLPSLRYKT